MPIDQAPSVETVVVRAINLPPAAGDAAFSILKLSPDALTSSAQLDQVLETAAGVRPPRGFRCGPSPGRGPAALW
jgi:hypothetical protein